MFFVWMSVALKRLCVAFPTAPIAYTAHINTEDGEGDGDEGETECERNKRNCFSILYTFILDLFLSEFACIV